MSLTSIVSSFKFATLASVPLMSSRILQYEGCLTSTSLRGFEFVWAVDVTELSPTATVGSLTTLVSDLEDDAVKRVVDLVAISLNTHSFQLLFYLLVEPPRSDVKAKLVFKVTLQERPLGAIWEPATFGHQLNAITTTTMTLIRWTKLSILRHMT